MNNLNKPFESDWIYNLECEQHWRYYWNQQRFISDTIKKEDSILEIGVGSGFTSNYLRSKGYNVTTLDIDVEKSPDIVANIIDYKFEKSFDHILAFEVFEHMPFENFKLVIARLSQICNKNLFVSLPRNEKVWFKFSADFKIFRINNFQITTKRNKIISKYHHWEIDYKSYTERNILNIFGENNFSLIKREKIFSLLFLAFKKINVK